MKELSKQINNAEARFQILELQMKQNEKDHKLILDRVEHNCSLQQARFDTIEGKIDSFMELVSERYAQVDAVKKISDRQWQALTWIATFGIVTIVGAIVYLFNKHII